MMRITRSSLAASLAAVALFGVYPASAASQEPIRLARTPDISPDGKLVTFSYLGDIWVVDAIGGVARPITSHPSHDVNPVFSPDGQQIAFSSKRHGSYDVFVVSVKGGKPRRLTFDSAPDLVAGWSPDGRRILFASTRGTDFPQGFELFTVPVEGGRAVRVSADEGKEGVFSPAGDRLAYVRGPGSWYRKGYRGSSNDDIWICNADGGSNRQLTNFHGQDGSPMWSADGKTVFYVSEFFGTPANIVKLPADASPGSRPTQVTFQKEDGVRRARISRNGEWIVYECGPDLCVVSTRDGSSPRKLPIEVYADDKENTEHVVTFTGDATDYAVSNDEKHVVIAVHGNLFMIPVQAQGKPTRLTETTASDHGMAWAPDGSKMLFLSDRDGQEDVYLLEPNDPDHPKFVEAHRFKVTRLTNTREAEVGLSFTPDGRRVGFLRAGKLWTMKPDGSDAKVVIDDIHVFDYEWSPDGKWVAYARRDGSFASELYLAPSTGPTAENPARNITRYATYNGGVTWSADGKKLGFVSERREPGSQAYVLSLQKPAATGVSEKTGPLEIDWDDIHLRAQRVVPVPVEEAAMAPDGGKIAFTANNRGLDLWIADSRGGQFLRVTNGNMRPHQIQWSKRRSSFGTAPSDLLFFLDGDGHLRMVRPGSGGDAAMLPFKVTMTIRDEDQYTEMFDQSWRYLAENFYDAKFHGLDWDAIRARYRPLVKHVALKEDLFALLYLMLGELNASHLGVSGYGPGPDQVTADLGLLFDQSYHGKGLKIAEVLKRGPADKRGLNLKPGDYVLAIDDAEIEENTDLSQLLNGKVNESVVLSVASNAGEAPKGRRRVEVQAADRGRISELMYERWVDHNARRVAELSKGRLGYIHIPTMDEDGLDKFVRSLYSDNFDKDAIVLDVRFNGGGFTHDQILNYLGAHEHTYFRQRDGGEGLVLRPYDRKWTKPLVLLINNRSYSDAEIFPNAFRTLGLGKLVGQATGGFVIGTGGVRLVDGSQFRIPRIGVFTTKGVNMEKEGVAPDVLVEPHPDQVAKGIDLQLDKAVEVLQEDLLAARKKSGAVALKPEEPAKATAAAAPPMPLVGPNK